MLRTELREEILRPWWSDLENDVKRDDRTPQMPDLCLPDKTRAQNDVLLEMLGSSGG
jgi:hypothetical protein